MIKSRLNSRAIYWSTIALLAGSHGRRRPRERRQPIGINEAGDNENIPGS